jgi:hypothetical protein
MHIGFPHSLQNRLAATSGWLAQFIESEAYATDAQISTKLREP